MEIRLIRFQGSDQITRMQCLEESTHTHTPVAVDTERGGGKRTNGMGQLGRVPMTSTGRPGVVPAVSTVA